MHKMCGNGKRSSVCSLVVKKFCFLLSTLHSVINIYICIDLKSTFYYYYSLISVSLIYFPQVPTYNVGIEPALESQINSYLEANNIVPMKPVSVQLSSILCSVFAI